MEEIMLISGICFGAGFLVGTVMSEEDTNIWVWGAGTATVALMFTWITLLVGGWL